MHQSILLLGSNQGDRIDIIKNALSCISNHIDIKLIAKSALYETAAWGDESLPPHINVAITISTNLKPESLLKTLQQIELDFGRTRTTKWGVRTLDIDIIYYDDLILQIPTLQIPHPLVQERKFALVPINDIAPKFIHPVFNIDNRTLLRNCKDSLNVVKIP